MAKALRSLRLSCLLLHSRAVLSRAPKGPTRRGNVKRPVGSSTTSEAGVIGASPRNKPPRSSPRMRHARLRQNVRKIARTICTPSASLPAVFGTAGVVGSNQSRTACRMQGACSILNAGTEQVLTVRAPPVMLSSVVVFTERWVATPSRLTFEASAHTQSKYK
jgi:hypothetical protein